MEMFIKIGMLVIFFGVMLFIGFKSRNSARDINGFVLGGRSVGPWLTAFAFGTSYFSAVVFIGYAGQFGWKFGISATWAGIGNALIGSLAAWAILGRRTRVITNHLKSATMPQFFGERFKSQGLRLWSAVITFVFLIPYTASLFNGLSRLFGMAFNVDYSVCVVVMAVLTAIYVIVGGYMATAINDFIQGIIMIFGICAVIFSVLKLNGGFMSALEGLAMVTDESVSSVPGVFASFFGPDPVSLLGVVLLTSLGTWGLPQMVQKFYAIKSEDDISKGMIISTVFAFIVAGGSYFLGGFGRLFSDKLDIASNGYDSIIPTMIGELPIFLISVVVILVLSASMSTLSSLVLTSSSVLTLDFLMVVGLKKAKEKTVVLIMKALVVLFIALSVAIAIIQHKSSVTFIAQLMGISWGALAGAFLAPFIYGLYWKRTTKQAVLVNFIFSVAIMTGNIFFKDFFPTILRSPINLGTFCMLAGLLIVPLVSLMTTPPEKSHIEFAFSCYKKPLEQRKEALTEE